MSAITKAIIIPGNGCGFSLKDCMWYPWLQRRLKEVGVETDLRAFPDHLYAREHIWKAFAVDNLGLDESTIVIGHSSGAACALRLMEEHAFPMCVLVSAYNTDLGDDLERGSGYFSRPFNYHKMRRNVGTIVQFHSQSDHLVPVAIGRDVAKKLGSVYVETEDDGHFQDDDYDDLMLPVLLQHIESANSKARRALADDAGEESTEKGAHANQAAE